MCLSLIELVRRFFVQLSVARALLACLMALNTIGVVEKRQVAESKTFHTLRVVQAGRGEGSCGVRLQEGYEKAVRTRAFSCCLRHS